jgi:hypothetical protein
VTVHDALRLVAGVVIASLCAGSAEAQVTVPTPPPPAAPPGWLVTPSVGVAELWDDNVALTSEAVGTQGDYVTAVSPGVVLGYRGRRTTLGVDYNGTYDFHRELTQFDTVDHRARGQFQQRLSERVNLFARDSYTRSPTTEILAPSTGLVVLQRRTTRFNDFRGGLELTPTDRTTITGAYTSQWIELARDELVAPLLRGGRSDGADITVEQRVATRVSLGAQYDGTRAVVANGGEQFNVQNALATVEVALSPTFTFLGGAGYSWQRAGVGRGTDGAPAYEAHLSYLRDRVNWEAAYIRSFLPSFGFGGTVQNEELSGTLRAPMGRHFEIAATGSVRDNNPVDRQTVALRSKSLTGTFGYLPTRWLRIEVFTLYSNQDTQVAGGQVIRSQTGVRVSTRYPKRLR